MNWVLDHVKAEEESVSFENSIRGRRSSIASELSEELMISTTGDRNSHSSRRTIPTREHGSHSSRSKQQGLLYRDHSSHTTFAALPYRDEHSSHARMGMAWPDRKSLRLGEELSGIIDDVEEEYSLNKPDSIASIPEEKKMRRQKSLRLAAEIVGGDDDAEEEEISFTQPAVIPQQKKMKRRFDWNGLLGDTNKEGFMPAVEDAPFEETTQDTFPGYRTETFGYNETADFDAIRNDATKLLEKLTHYEGPLDDIPSDIFTDETSSQGFWRDDTEITMRDESTGSVFDDEYCPGISVASMSRRRWKARGCCNNRKVLTILIAIMVAVLITLGVTIYNKRNGQGEVVIPMATETGAPVTETAVPLTPLNPPTLAPAVLVATPPTGTTATNPPSVMEAPTGTVAPTRRNPWQQVGQDLFGNVAASFGASVALSMDGSIMAVGSPGSGNDSFGSVSVFKKDDDDSWKAHGQTIISTEDGRDDWGYRVAISFDGSVLALSAYRANSSTGLVRVYHWDEDENNRWLQRGQDLVGNHPSDEFGYSLDLSGNGRVLAVGAPQAGVVRVYSWNRNNNSWDQRGHDFVEGDSNAMIGSSVALSHDGSIIALGLPGIGIASVHKWNMSTKWTQFGPDISRTNVKAEQSLDLFGSEVELSYDGDIIVVGSQQNEDMNATDAGGVHAFVFDGLNWIRRGETIAGEEASETAGVLKSIAVSGDASIIVTGVPYSDRETHNEGKRHDAAGKVGVFQWNERGWTRHGDSLHGRVPGDLFGSTVASSLDGSIIAVGSPKCDENGHSSGRVQVYRYDDL